MHKSINVIQTCTFSFFEVVLPTLREWHGQLRKPFKLGDVEVNVEESDAGIEDTEKHVDTKMVIIANDDRLVLHAYNSTQNLMVQGKNSNAFAVNYLEPFFTDKISIKKVAIEQFNSNVQKTFGTAKTAAIKKKTNGSKPFHCPHCKVKSSNVADLNTHVKTSYSLKVVKRKSRKEVTQILNENTSILDETSKIR